MWQAVLLSFSHLLQENTQFKRELITLKQDPKIKDVKRKQAIEREKHIYRWKLTSEDCTPWFLGITRCAWPRGWLVFEVGEDGSKKAVRLTVGKINAAQNNVLPVFLILKKLSLCMVKKKTLVINMHCFIAYIFPWGTFCSSFPWLVLWSAVLNSNSLQRSLG